MKTDSVPSLDECLAAASDTKAFFVGQSALDELPELIERFFPGEKAFIIADENTFHAAGRRVMAKLQENGMQVSGTFTFPGSPRLHADYHHVMELVARLKREQVDSLLPIVVGAGTLNDLVKRSAFEIGRPYLCIPTAASVDGYTSYGAALLADGYKQTLECSAPRVVVADASILAAAPAYLSSSGFGDLASKIIAGTDWLIAEEAGRAGAPGTEPIDSFAWAMTQTGLRSYLARSEAAWRGDHVSVGALFQALALTGFSMQYLRSSRPVSGCEHLFSHVWEMEDLSVGGVPVTHGHKVAIGTLCATALTETIFSRESPPAVGKIHHPSLVDRVAETRTAFAGLPAVDAVVGAVTAKLLGPSAETRLVSALADNWRALGSRVLDHLMPYSQLRSMLEKAGCPTKPEDIGLTRTEAIATSRKAQMIRNRYTVLDLAWDFGILEDALKDIEESTIYLR